MKKKIKIILSEEEQANELPPVTGDLKTTPAQDEALEMLVATYANEEGQAGPTNVAADSENATIPGLPGLDVPKGCLDYMASTFLGYSLAGGLYAAFAGPLLKDAVKALATTPFKVAGGAAGGLKNATAAMDEWLTQYKGFRAKLVNTPQIGVRIAGNATKVAGMSILQLTNMAANLFGVSFTQFRSIGNKYKEFSAAKGLGASSVSAGKLAWAAKKPLVGILFAAYFLGKEEVTSALQPKALGSDPGLFESFLESGKDFLRMMVLLEMDVDAMLLHGSDSKGNAVGGGIISTPGDENVKVEPINVAGFQKSCETIGTMASALAIYTSIKGIGFVFGSKGINLNKVLAAAKSSGGLMKWSGGYMKSLYMTEYLKASANFRDVLKAEWASMVGRAGGVEGSKVLNLLDDVLKSQIEKAIRAGKGGVDELNWKGIIKALSEELKTMKNTGEISEDFYRSLMGEIRNIGKGALDPLLSPLEVAHSRATKTMNAVAKGDPLDAIPGRAGWKAQMAIVLGQIKDSMRSVADRVLGPARGEQAGLAALELSTWGTDAAKAGTVSSLVDLLKNLKNLARRGVPTPTTVGRAGRGVVDKGHLVFAGKVADELRAAFREVIEDIIKANRPGQALKSTDLKSIEQFAEDLVRILSDTTDETLTVMLRKGKDLFPADALEGMGITVAKILETGTGTAETIAEALVNGYLKTLREAAARGGTTDALVALDAIGPEVRTMARRLLEADRALNPRSVRAASVVGVLTAIAAPLAIVSSYWDADEDIGDVEKYNTSLSECNGSDESSLERNRCQWITSHLRFLVGLSTTDANDKSPKGGQFFKRRILGNLMVVVASPRKRNGERINEAFFNEIMAAGPGSAQDFGRLLIEKLLEKWSTKGTSWYDVIKNVQEYPSDYAKNADDVLYDDDDALVPKVAKYMLNHSSLGDWGETLYNKYGNNPAQLKEKFLDKEEGFRFSSRGTSGLESNTIIDFSKFANAVNDIKNYRPELVGLKNETTSNEAKVIDSDLQYLRKLVSDMLVEYYDPGYIDYPYSSEPGTDDEEPRDDYLEDWKSMELELVQDKSRQKAIDLAKILVKDLELFNDVVDLVGQNQSIGKEILSRLHDDKKPNKNNS